MDLPSDDSSAFFDDYAAVVCAALADDPGDDLIIVGHSLSGLTIPLVAAQRPVRRLVYLCAVSPIPGQPFVQQMAEDTDMLNANYTKGLGEKDSQGRRAWFDVKLAHFQFVRRLRRSHRVGGFRATETAVLAALLCAVFVALYSGRGFDVRGVHRRPHGKPRVVVADRPRLAARRRD